MTRILISDDALVDLDDGYWFYETKEAGLGEYFATSIRSDIEGLKVSAGVHRRGYDDYCRVLSKTFPYAIYYTCAENEVTVWAIIDCRRDPEWIRSHLQKHDGE